MIREELAHAAELPSIPMEEKKAITCCYIGCENFDPAAEKYCSNDCYSEEMNRQHLRMEGSPW